MEEGLTAVVFVATIGAIWMTVAAFVLPDALAVGAFVLLR